MTDWTAWEYVGETPAFETPRKALALALAHVQRATAAKNSIPILTYILVAARGDKIRLSATNLSVSIVVELDAVVTKEGEIALPSKLVTELVEKLSGDTITVTSNNKTQTATLKCGRQTSPVRGLEGEDFPPIKQPANPVVLSVPGSSLMEMLTFAIQAAKDDAVDQTLGSVHIYTPEEGKIQAAAIDGSRMNRSIIACEWADPLNLLIPESSLRYVLGVFSPDHPIEIVTEVGTFHASFRQGNVSVTTRTVDAAFPDVGKIVPSEFAYACTIDLAELRDHIKVASISAKEAQNVLRLNITRDKLEIIAKAPNVLDYSGVMDIETMSSGEPMGKDDVHARSINVTFLLSALSLMRTSHVRIEMANPMKMFVIKEVDGRGENAVCLIAPMVNRD